METLLELLTRISGLIEAAADPERPLAGVPQDELETLLTELQDAYAEARQGELTVEIVDALEQASTTIQTIVTEDNTRVAEAEALEARAAELDELALIPAAQDDETQPGEGEAPPVDETEEEAPVEEPEAPAEEVVEERVLVPARSAPTPRVPIRQMRQRQPAAATPRPRINEGDSRRVIAAAGLPNVAAGGEFESRHQLAEAMIQTWDANANAAGDGVKVAVARVQTPYPQRLSTGLDAFGNGNIVREAIEGFQDNLVAAGGICAPTVPYYPQAMVSQSARPIFDGLPRVGADRGGINFVTPPTLASVVTSGGSAAVGQVTAAQDLSGTTKTHQLITCGTPTTTQVYAVTNILEFGNLQSRTYPELVEAWSGLGEAAWARFAENLLLTGIVTGSTAVTSLQKLGVARDMLGYITVASTAYRNRHRMDPNASIVVMLPAWLIGAIQTDVWFAFNTGSDEAASVTQARIEQWLASRNVRVIWFQDGVGPGNPAAQIFPAQAAGSLLSWPTVCQWYLFHEGAWLVLDGGTLDLGIVRDSTLNAANKYQMFFESFENIAFVGVESLRIRTTICVNGATSGTVTPSTVCSGGS